MALDTYANLQTAIAKWLNRETDTDLLLQLPDFIALAEAEIKRRLRRTSVRATITISAYATTPPTDIASLRSIRLVSGQPSQDLPFRIGTKEMVDERKARSAGVAGRPDTAAIFSGEILVAPCPDQPYSAEIIYFKQLTPLSVTNPSNSVLVEAPDAYLFGALLQAEPYLEHDERMPVWEKKFDNAIEQLLHVRDEEEHGAAFQGIRLPVVFG